MHDLNKTPETHILTFVAECYLASVGCKPVATEVSVYSFGIVDLAAFCCPSDTEIKKLKLAGELPRIFRDFWGTSPLITFAVEVKASRSDFLKDIDRKFNAPVLPAHLCFLAYPKKMLKPEEIPKRWIGLEINTDKKRIIRIRRNNWDGKIRAETSVPAVEFIANIAIRHSHSTNQFLQQRKEAFRNYREEKKIEKTVCFIQRLADWLKGEYPDWTFSQMVGFTGLLKDDELKHLQKEITFFESLRQEKTRDVH
jgi:hypothetical protein